MPSDMRPGGRNFHVTKRRSMNLMSIGLIGRAHADYGFAADHGGFSAGLLGRFDCRLDRYRIVAVDVRHHMPPVGFKALGCVVGKPSLHMAIYGDAVVVVEADQLAQSERARQRAGLMGNTFHEAAVAQEYVRIMIDDIEAGTVKLRGKNFFRQRHPHRIGNTLPQRSGSGFHARRISVFRMAGSLGMKLAEALDFLHRQVVAGEVQQGINQHRAMSIGQYEPVAVSPLWDWRDCGANDESTIPQLFPPYPWACRGDPNWLFAQRPWPARE